MNDCFWAMVFCEDRCKCKKYVSMNSADGQELMERYKRDIDSAIDPVRSEWKDYFDEL